MSALRRFIKTDFIKNTFAKKAIWNLLAEASPFVFAVVSIPLLISLIGPERFGLLSIIWILVGYFNLFDLGLSRSITHFAASSLGDNDRAKTGEVFWSGLGMILALGVFISILLLWNAGSIVSYMKIDERFQAEVENSIRLLAFAVPLVMAATAFKGLLQADQRFRTISFIQIPFGAWVFVGPVICAWFGIVEIDSLTIVLITGRILLLLWFVVAGKSVLPNLFQPTGSIAQLRTMMNYSGWIAVSNVVGPLMVYFDRVVISSFLGLLAVTNYVIPFDLIHRTGIIPASIATVVFTSVSFENKASNKESFRKIHDQAALSILALTTPLYATAAIFSFELLSLWVGADQAELSAPTMIIICLALLLNSLTRVPHAILQGAGQSKLTAYAHMFELPIYLLALVICIPRYGIEGAAWVWFLRCGLDFGLLNFCCWRLRQLDAKSIAKLAVILLALILLIWMTSQLGYLPAKILVCSLIILISAIVGLRFLQRG